MEKTILVDCDGVILSWNEAFEEHMLEKGYDRVHGTDDQYSLAKRFGVDEDFIYDEVLKFNQSEMIANLLPHKDAVSGVQRLVDKGFRFTAITSLSDAPKARAHRVNNLRGVFGDIFEEIICLPLASSKQYTLRRWAGSGLFWIEDHFKNAEAGHEEGLRSIVVDTPYNRHYHTDLFPRVNSEKPWEEICEIVFSQYNIEE
jgi:FMN phosphatase YigB (HAD superfamily)